jgi:endonuclease YncB( thermonuclease family)
MIRRRRSRSSPFSNQLIALFFMLLLTFAVGYLSRFLSEPIARPFRAQGEDNLLAASGQSLRLEGIDAPEYRQMCGRSGVSYPCGREAAAQLRRGWSTVRGSNATDTVSIVMKGFSSGAERAT